MRKKEGRSKENWKRGRGRENDENQRGSGQGWMGVKGDRESGRGGGDRSVSVKDETPKQVSKRQTDTQNTLSMAAGVMNTFIRHSTAEDKEHLSVRLAVIFHTSGDTSVEQNQTTVFDTLLSEMEIFFTFYLIKEVGLQP